MGDSSFLIVFPSYSINQLPGLPLFCIIGFRLGFMDYGRYLSAIGKSRSRGRLGVCFYVSGEQQRWAGLDVISSKVSLESDRQLCRRSDGFRFVPIACKDAIA